MNIHAFVGFRNSKPSKREDAGLHLRQRANSHQPSISLTHYNIAPSDVVSILKYRSALMLPLLWRKGHSLNTYIFKHTKAIVQLSFS